MAKEETNALDREEQAPPLRTQSEPEKVICCREDKPNSSINQNLKLFYVGAEDVFGFFDYYFTRGICLEIGGIAIIRYFNIDR